MNNINLTINNGFVKSIYIENHSGYYEVVIVVALCKNDVVICEKICSNINYNPNYQYYPSENIELLFHDLFLLLHDELMNNEKVNLMCKTR